MFLELLTLFSCYVNITSLQSLHVKDRPGGGIAEQLMSYVWGFVWRHNLGNHANLTKKLGKIMYVTWNEPGEQMKTYF
jgi:hypothetical protein